MGAQNGPIDGPWQKRRTIDGNAMVHRWPMDGLPWDPNSGKTSEAELQTRNTLFLNENTKKQMGKGFQVNCVNKLCLKSGSTPWYDEKSFVAVIIRHISYEMSPLKCSKYN